MAQIKNLIAGCLLLLSAPIATSTNREMELRDNSADGSESVSATPPNESPITMPREPAGRRQNPSSERREITESRPENHRPPETTTQQLGVDHGRLHLRITEGSTTDLSLATDPQRQRGLEASHGGADRRFVKHVEPNLAEASEDDQGLDNLQAGLDVAQRRSIRPSSPSTPSPLLATEPEDSTISERPLNLTAPRMTRGEFLEGSECSSPWSHVWPNETLPWITFAEICSLSCTAPRPGGSYGFTKCPICFCDPQCKEFGDCCPDHKAHEDHYLPDLKTDEECLEVGDASKDESMISHCPSGHALQAECGRVYSWPFLPDPEGSTVPVTAASNGRHYRNYACALCNGISDVIWWEGVARCVGRLPRDPLRALQAAATRNDCSLTFLPSELSPPTTFLNPSPLCYHPSPPRKCEVPLRTRLKNMPLTPATGGVEDKTGEEEAEEEEQEEDLSSLSVLQDLCRESPLQPVTDLDGRSHANVFCLLCSLGLTSEVCGGHLERHLASGGHYLAAELMHTYRLTFQSAALSLAGPVTSWSGLNPNCHYDVTKEGKCKPVDFRLANKRRVTSELETDKKNQLLLCFSANLSHQEVPHSELPEEAWEGAGQWLPETFALPPSTVSYLLCPPSSFMSDPAAGSAELLVLVNSPEEKAEEVLQMLLKRYKDSDVTPRRELFPHDLSLQLRRCPCVTMETLMRRPLGNCFGNMPTMAGVPSLPGVVLTVAPWETSAWVLSPLLSCFQTMVTSPEDFEMLQDGYLRLTESGRRLMNGDYYLLENSVTALVCEIDLLPLPSEVIEETFTDGGEVPSVTNTSSGNRRPAVETLAITTTPGSVQCCQCCDGAGEDNEKEEEEESKERAKKEKCPEGGMFHCIPLGRNEPAGLSAEELKKEVEDDGTGICPLCCYAPDISDGGGDHEAGRKPCGSAPYIMRSDCVWLGGLVAFMLMMQQWFV